MTDLTSANLLINNIYPLGYFQLKGVSAVPFPNKGPWCSTTRFAAVDADGEKYLSVQSGGKQTSEILEVDLGYVRTINYLTFDIQTAPVSITLEYDAVSSAGQNHQWIQVTPMQGEPFDNNIQFNPQSLHAWINTDMYFTDAKGNPVQSRYLRLTFTRKDPWPIPAKKSHPLGIHDTAPPGQFRWPICVRNLHVGMFTVPTPGKIPNLGLIEATGLLFQQEPIGLIPFLPDDDTGVVGTQIRQRFVIPENATRGTGSDAVVPTILGFGVFVNVPIPELLGNISQDYLTNDVKYGWEMWDITDPNNLVKTNAGVETGAVTFGDQWVDVYFDIPQTPGGPPPGPPPPPTKQEKHCGQWNWYQCANDPHAGTPQAITHWYWFETTLPHTASLAPPQEALAQGALTYDQLIKKTPFLHPQLGPINETQPFFPCGIAVAGGSFAPQGPYCYSVTVPNAPKDPNAPPAAPSTTQHCGHWVTFQIPHGPGGVTVLGVCWYDQTAGTYSTIAPHGAPQQPFLGSAKLSLPGPGQTPTTCTGCGLGGATFCWDVTNTPTPQPPPKNPNNRVYELRIWSLDTTIADQFYLSEPNNLSDRSIPGTVALQKGSTTVSTSVDLTGSLNINDWFIVSGVIATIEEEGGGNDTPLSYQVANITSTAITLDRAYAQNSNPSATILQVFPSYGWNGTQYAEDGQQNFAIRVWGNTGASGQDVLGNSYRYATQEKQADDVLINSKDGWLSAPMPSQNAVEALYFDVRGVDDNGDYIYQVIDALQITPTTPGAQMSIYYSQSNLTGHKPVTVDDYDYLLWTPVANHTFSLKKRLTIQFPTQVKASFMKLEFTALQPLPYYIPTFPPFPPQIYRRYPTWIELQFDNTQVRSQVQDWWFRNSTPVERQILNELADPVREFEYEEGLMFAQLTLNTPPANTTVTPPVPPIDVKSSPSPQLFDHQALATVDPTTGRKIWLSGLPNQFSATMLVNVNQDTILGKTVISKFDPNTFTTQAEQLPPPIPASSVPSVSSTSNRVTDAFSLLANTPMRFNTTCRHVYRLEWGEFNKKAFFIGIKAVKFMRTDFTVKHDDILIQDILHDDFLLVDNTWFRSGESTIPDGATVFVTYRVDGVNYVDEQVTLNGTIPIQLTGKGPQLYNVLVYSEHEKLGIQYFELDDFTISLGLDDSYKRTYSISRSGLVERVEAPPHPSVYSDAAVVTGYGYGLPSNTWTDSATVAAVGTPISYYERFGLTDATYGLNTFGTGHYGDLE
jgi:hypothetical protein